MSKADRCDEKTLEGSFDRFFTLFVIFNRLYALASYQLIESKKIPIPKKRFVPDKEGATLNVVIYLGGDTINKIINLESNYKKYCDLCSLIESETFHIKLDRLTGKARRKLDLQLLENLRDEDSDIRAIAILEVIYHVRCNMFHGHKSFEGVQKQLIDPLCDLMKSISDKLYFKLKDV